MAHATWSSRYLLSAALAGVLSLMACKDGVVTFTGGTASLRVFNAQTKTGALDIVADSVRVLSALGNGILSNSFNVPSGTYVLLEAYSAEPNQTLRIASQRYVMADKQSYTIIVRGATITDFLRPIVDTVTSPFPDQAAIKVINATEETFVSLLANDSVLGTPIVDAQTVMPFARHAPGTFRLRVLDSDRNEPIGADSTVVLERGACYYLFVYDLPSGSSLVQRWFLWKVQ
jgi:hypothetical protein